MIGRAPRFHSVEGARLAGRRRIPRVAFDFVDGGAEDETTLRANRRAFDAVEFVPRLLAPGPVADLAVEVCGTRISMPVGIGPTGFAGIVQPGADLAGARAAAAAGTVFTLGTLANSSIEEFAAAATGPSWFQFYNWSDKDAVEALMERAKAANFSALVVTVDCPDIGKRERDHRNGFDLPPRPTLRNTWDLIRHPSWTRSMLMGGFDFPNVRPPGTPAPVGLRAALKEAHLVDRRLLDCSIRPDDLTWVRERWSGPMIVKGILGAEDARLAVDCGADGVVVSNHGGRQLDGAAPTITVLPEVVRAVGPDVDVLLDSGVRRGSDVIKALALGAKACLIGRAWIYGLSAAGEDGVRRVLEVLREEMVRTLTLLGARDLAELPDLVRRDGGDGKRPELAWSGDRDEVS